MCFLLPYEKGIGRLQCFFVHWRCLFSGHPLAAAGKLHQFSVQSWSSRRDPNVSCTDHTMTKVQRSVTKPPFYNTAKAHATVLSQHCDQLMEVLWWKPWHKSKKKPTKLKTQNKTKIPQRNKNQQSSVVLTSVMTRWALVHKTQKRLTGKGVKHFCLYWHHLNQEQALTSNGLEEFTCCVPLPASPSRCCHVGICTRKNPDAQ